MSQTTEKEMGAALGRLTGRSPAYSLLLLFVLARHTARLLRGPDKLVATARVALLQQIAGLLSGTSRVKQLISDALGLVLGWKLICWTSSLSDFYLLTSGQKYDQIGAVLFNAFKGVPPISWKLAKESRDMENGLRKTLKSCPHIHSTCSVLPERGRSTESLLAEIESMVAKEDPKWKNGWVSGAVYHGGTQHLDCLNKVSSLYTLSNPLHPDVWPSVRKFEAEVCSMTASFLNGGDKNVVGCMTSGGTESILMAVKAHREWGLLEKGITEPELIIPATAHAAFDKACDCLRIKLIKLPVDQTTFQVDPALVEKRITGNTILIVGSAPNYPQGIIDPIRKLSKIAQSKRIGLHVDCCLGGFVLPFAKDAGFDVPEFDFRLAGVTSISCDTHKYGYAIKGTSVVLFRNKSLRRHMYWCYADWTGGLYCTPTLAGSRSGALSAACWASMMRMGRAGYTDAVGKIMRTRQKLQAGIDAIEGISVMGNPQAMVVAWESNSLNVYAIADRMSGRGWSINSLQKPASVHICVTYPHTRNGVAERFLKDLREIVEIIKLESEVARRENEQSKSDPGGTAPIYGMTAALPKGPVNQMLCSYVDVVLEV